MAVDASNSEGKPSTKDSKKKPPLIRVILRRLPYTMTAEELLEQLQPLPPHEHFQFVDADPSTHPWAFSRAYFAFHNESDVLAFRDRFNGYVFLDAKGNESIAIVELAPNPKLPKQKMRDAKKEDNKCGTLEDDVEYKKFLDDRRNPPKTEIVSLEQRLKELEEREKSMKGALIQETPLTQFIVKKYDDKVQRQTEKRRQRDEERRSRMQDQDRVANRFKTKDDGGKKQVTKKTTPVSTRPTAVYKSKPAGKTSAAGGQQPSAREKASGEAGERKLSNTRPASGNKEEGKETGTGKEGSAGKEVGTGKEGGASKEVASSGRRNKDRPERAIYQPGSGGRRRDAPQ